MSAASVFAGQEETQPFWDGVAAGRLFMPFDAKAGEWVWPPGGSDLVWRGVSGRGSVASYSVVHRAPSSANPHPQPYVIAFVTLDEGPRLFTRLVGVPARDVVLGMRVTVRMEAVEEGGALLPVFAPVDMEGVIS